MSLVTNATRNRMGIRATEINSELRRQCRASRWRERALKARHRQRQRQRGKGERVAIIRTNKPTHECAGVNTKRGHRLCWKRNGSPARRSPLAVSVSSAARCGHSFRTGDSSRLCPMINATISRSIDQLPVGHC